MKAYNFPKPQKFKPTLFLYRQIGPNTGDTYLYRYISDGKDMVYQNYSSAYARAVLQLLY